jgi:oligo-1,6-glucosidase
MGDFHELLDGIHARDMRLLMDLVVNHTSDEHEWFVESRKSKENPYRDYYFWKPGKDGGPPNNWISFFGGSAWEFDDQTGEYFLHLFWRRQPDLNWENPAVRQKVQEVLRFWLDKGIDGFRMDVIPLISKRLAFEDADLTDAATVIETVYSNGPRVHEYIQEFCRNVLSQYDIMTVGEGPGITKDRANLYVGKDRKELNMIFHLDHMFMGWGARGRFDPVPQTNLQLKKIFREWDEAIGDEGWISIFLDNHDFPRLVSRFGNDGKYRKESAKLFAMLLLTLRGTPSIYYGSELGMTNCAFEVIDDYRDVESLNFYRSAKENGMDEDSILSLIQRYGRDNVRTPMQWNDEMHAGFSDGNPWIRVNPNYREINVEESLTDNESILAFYKKMIRLRKLHPAFTYGIFQDLEPDHAELFVYLRQGGESRYLVVLNMSDKSVRYELPEAIGVTSILLCNYHNAQEHIYAPWEARLFLCEK